MRVIGFAGYKGSGKSHIAKQLSNWCFSHGYRVEIVSFDKIAVGGGKRCYSKKSGHESVQQEMKEYLTTTHTKERQQYSDLCTYDLENEFREQIIIIDDVSYLDDIRFIRSFNGVIVFVDASQRLNIPSIDIVKENLAHSTTKGLYPLETFDMILNNNSTLKALSRILTKSFNTMVLI